MKRIVALTLILTLCMTSTISIAYAEETKEYSDISSSHWAYDSISKMSEQGIIEGYENGEFRPKKTVTYGEFIKMMVLTSGVKDPGNSKPPENWANNYYNKAVELKYFDRLDIRMIQLNDPITREDAALIVSSALKNIKVNDYEGIRAKITDVNSKIEHLDAIIKAYASGIITGYADNTFRPENNLTRAEAAVILNRYTDEDQRVIPESERGKTAAQKILDRMKNNTYGSSSETGNLIESSSSRLPLSDMVSSTTGIPSLKLINYYEIVEDFPYSLELYTTSDGGEYLKVGNTDFMRLAVLITDKKITKLNDRGGNLYWVGEEGSKFPTHFDYLGFYLMSLDTMILIPSQSVN